MPPDFDSQDEFEALKVLSAQVGADPLLVQAAGGNTSIKIDKVLWVKASGTWLMHARSQDIFVPVDLQPLCKAVFERHPAAEKAQDFCVASLNTKGLRPSIETTFHAIIPHRVVVHVHCVDTIAIAVQMNANAILNDRLAGLDWGFVPYQRPGIPLTYGIAEVLTPTRSVYVLGNHGLVVAADSVAETAALLSHVRSRLEDEERNSGEPDKAALASLAEGTNYSLPTSVESHWPALDPTSLKIVERGSLYPDHVIFLGAGSVIARPNDTVFDVVDRARAQGMPPPTAILFPKRGVLMRSDASAGAEALAACLGRVTSRIPAGADVRTLTEAENGALLNWDAEKYRQTLDAQHTIAS